MPDYHVVRGAAISWRIKFYDSQKSLLSPTNATLYISYERNGEQMRESIPMTAGQDGDWIAEWDSSVADAGFVHWHARCGGNPIAANEGRIVLLANPANPDPT